MDRVWSGDGGRTVIVLCLIRYGAVMRAIANRPYEELK